MPPVAARDTPAQRLADIYLRAWGRLKAEEAALVNDPLAARRVARLRELEREVGRLLAGLDSSVRDWIGQQLPVVWAAGATHMAGIIAGGGTFGWTRLHQQGIQQVAAATYDYLLDANRYITASTRALIQSIVHDETLAKLTGGTTAVQEGRVIVGRLVAETGLSRVAYSNGALHPVSEYGQMVARTQTALAYNYGTMQQALTEGVEMLEVFDGAGCGWDGHDDPNQANGEVVTVKEAAQFPISHPNCVRAFGPRPDLKAPGGPQPEAVEQAALGAKSPAGRTFAQQAASTRHEKVLAARAAKINARTARQ